MVALYDPEAAFLAQPGQPVVSGLDAIREALAAFLALKPTITRTIDVAIEADGVALVLNRWSLAGNPGRRAHRHGRGKRGRHASPTRRPLVDSHR